MQGIIIKGIAGFYYVKVEDEVVECKARGKFRFNELSPMVGDKVEISVKNNKGVIEKILDRSSELIRPSVANVTQAFVVSSIKNPDLNIDLLYKFLLVCEFHNLKAVICFNKIDLAEESEKEHIVETIMKMGYDIVFLKAKEGIGMDDLRHRIDNNVTVLCGPSGVGKSTILNKLSEKEVMKTGDISEKLGRGKHTTRHSELIQIGNGFMVDTPGFSSLDINFIKKQELRNLFPEFIEYNDQCKYAGCLHNKEPKCAVKEAVEDNNILQERYNFYIRMLNEIENLKVVKYE